MGSIKVDLHEIYNNSKAIDRALQEAFENAIDKKIKEVEIIWLLKAAIRIKNTNDLW